MILNIDTDDKDFIVTKAPGPKLDEHQQHRISKDTGEPIWATQLVVTDDSGGEVITVNTNGPQPPDVKVGDAVDVVDLVAIPWTSKTRSGIAFRARAILG